MDPTEERSLGKTRVKVSRLGLGTVGLGGMFAPVTHDEAVATVRAAATAGLRLLDTAPVYGYGNAERAIAEAMDGIPRESITLTTKVGRILLPDGPPADEDRMVLYDGQQLFRGTPEVRPYWDFSYDGALRSFEQSLQRLGTDRVDALYIHDPDDHISAASDGCYRAVARLRDEGVIGAVGSGSNSDEALLAMLDRVELDCILIAGRYTLLDQRALSELLPLCERNHVSVVIGGVYNSGLLCHPDPRRALEADRSVDAMESWANGVTFDYVPAEREHVEAAMRIAEVCARHETPVMSAAIQFPLAHPAVATVLMGPRNRRELEQNLAMFDFDVPVTLWEELAESGLIGRDAPVPS